ncbi:PREDICTED: phosphatidylinositol 3,4,5-trisphosphate 3-phosphatase and protein-tyrosine-phosphatase PTEN1 [Tarenaya hassleriana]|uniref:phosphatidylinositol 3,4,5-trisphosphate 3-phosphatase and protein-tyrosine-phosphatase PTEN1 n=1 Tax=Tarenaya hassleriana TaxID=28532 RepID=UPI00053C2EA0|nr:PREDICTED: phosphatidylinositol 3,4,5-trisphosphate 3-phosphatase and protein-tyrosine-phosphatase PTEN1 [Tarenaya hassleriana]
MGLKLSKGSARDKSALDCTRAHILTYLTASAYLRSLVSRKRRRMVIGGYDLDMSYITDRLLAMSFPAERMRAFYRNPLWQVKSVLDMRHPDHYKIYNLCIEEAYDPANFYGRVERFPFDDNHVPSLHMIKLFCESVYAWLSQDSRNIAVIHCMAGKGRTGLMVSAYLVYSGMTAEEALEMYAQRRTTNNNGVSIPSQRRYVKYWSDSLRFPRGVGNRLPEVKLPLQHSRELRRIRLYDTANIDAVFFVVSEQQEIPNELYRPPVEVVRGCCRQVKKGCCRNTSPRYYVSHLSCDSEEEEEIEREHIRLVVQMDTESSIIDEKTCLDYYFEKPERVSGDICITFYQKMIGTRLFYTCFNTAFITNGLLQFSIAELDKVGGQGRSICGPDFSLELLFGPAYPKYGEVLPCEESAPQLSAPWKPSC